MKTGCDAVTIQAFPGKYIDGVKQETEFRQVSKFSIDDKRNAKRIVDEMQGVLDLDCEPCRVYLHNPGDPIPFYAALGRSNGR